VVDPSDQERVALVQLARTDGVGAITFHRLIQRFGSASSAIAALPDMAKAAGRRTGLTIYLKSRAEDEMARVAQLGARYVSATDHEYPKLLAEVDGAPPLLCIKGHADWALAPCVAIVGARNASATGRKFTRMLADRLTQAGMTVVSGLARGIDTAAHEASRDMQTMAVIAGGIDHIYPPENAELQNAIAERGLLITEMPPGTAPKAEHFPRRNRIISGLSRAVIVVEAALRSGSLITARFAAEQGRDVFAVPGSPLDPRCEGCNKLIKDGAAILTSLDDVFDALNAQSPMRRGLFAEEPQTLRRDVTPEGADRDKVVGLLSPNPVHIDDIVRESGLSPEVVSAVLLELEIVGRAGRDGSGMVSLRVS
jgi:DNA processing protein